MTKHLLNLTKDFHLHQAVREPTCKNILELFLTTNPSLIESTHSIPGISDHDSMPLLNINVNLPRNSSPPYKTFKYHKAEYEHIDQNLQNLGNKIQNQVPLTDSPEPLWDVFKHSIQDIINQFIPFKYSSKRYSLPWVNKDIQTTVQQSQEIPRETDWTSFRKFRKATQKKIQLAYWKYLTHIIDPEQDKDKKSFWHYIKSLIYHPKHQPSRGTPAPGSKIRGP